MLTESMRLFCLKDLLEREGKKLLFKELPKMVSLISAAMTRKMFSGMLTPTAMTAGCPSVPGDVIQHLPW